MNNIKILQKNKQTKNKHTNKKTVNAIMQF